MPSVFRPPVLLSVVQNKAEITSHTADCILEGSQHVSAMNLNERFELDVKIVFTWDEKQQKENAIHVDGSLKVEVRKGL